MATAGAPVIDDVFGVIVHPVRRQLLERLATGERRVTDLAGPLPVSRSAVSQHLRLMLRLGVVSERRDGRERYYRLQPEGLHEVKGWLERIDRFWADGLDRLGAHKGTSRRFSKPSLST